MKKTEMTEDELTAEKERARLEYESSCTKSPDFNYGRWGQRRLKFMEENILIFWGLYPQSNEEKKLFLKNFDDQCMAVYQDILDKTKSMPEAKVGDYASKSDLLTQADLLADETILHDLVYNEIYTGFAKAETISWESYLLVMSNGMKNITPELEKHWRYLWETYDKKHSV